MCEQRPRPSALRGSLSNAPVDHTCTVRSCSLAHARSLQGFFHFENVMEIGREAGVVSASSVLCKPNPKAYQLVAQRLGVDMAEVGAWGRARARACI